MDEASLTRYARLLKLRASASIPMRELLELVDIIAEVGAELDDLSNAALSRIRREEEKG